MIATKTKRWQCSGCDHLCAMLTDEIIKPGEIIRCPQNDEWRIENPKAQLSKVRDRPKYWAWKDKTGAYWHIYNRKFVVEMCSPDGFKAVTERGEGKIVKVIMEEVDG